MDPFWTGFLTAFAVIYLTCGIVFSTREILRSINQQNPEDVGLAVIVWMIFALLWIFFVRAARRKHNQRVAAAALRQ